MNQNKLTFDTENLQVDFLTLKFQFLDDDKQLEIANYLFTLGFNSSQESDSKFYKSNRKTLYYDFKNKFEVIFVVDFSYWNGTLLNFCGSNANYLYSILKQKSFKWQIFHTASLSRFDLCFERNSKTLNATSTNNFLDHCFRNLQKLNKKTTLEKNRNGWILKIGHRRSNNYFRVYKKQETSLRFEHEMKGKPLREYFVLLMEDNFEEFEQKLSLHFIVSFGKLFSLDSVYLDWLAIKLRPIRQCKITKSYLNSHYIGFNNFDSFENRQGFFNLLQFLVYVNDLDYTMGHLDSTTYRLVVFKVQDFLKYQNPTVKSTNYYPFHFPPSFFFYTSTINLQVKLSIIRSFAQESSSQKTYLIRSFLNRYKKRSHSIQAQLKKDILDQFYHLLKAKIIEPRFQVSVNGNNFITKDNIQLQDIQAAKVIYFYEIIYPI